MPSLFTRKRPVSGIGLMLPTHQFQLQVHSIIVGGFTEVSGLSDEIEVESIQEGGQDRYLLQSPTRVRHSRLVLKRGMISMELREWFDRFRKDQVIDRRDIDVFQLNSTGDRKFHWAFEKALPVKWNGPAFNSMSSALAFETIEFVHLGMEMTTVG